MREYGSEQEITYARDDYFDRLAAFLPHHAYTRSGREALGLAAEGAGGGGVALLPAYCCQSMVLPMERAGLAVAYYRLRADLTADASHLREQIVALRPRLVLVMNYFGFAPARAAIDAAAGRALIVEDFTQRLLSLREADPRVSVYAASLRKSIGVSDGGLALSRLPLPTERLQEASATPFIAAHQRAGRLKTLYRHTGREADKQTFRTLQAEAAADINAHYRLCHISREALDIARHTLAALYAEARTANYQTLYGALRPTPLFRILFRPEEATAAPFGMVVLSPRRDALQRALAQRGVYAQVLWPLTDAQRRLCPVAARMEREMLLLPVDQRYTRDDMLEMADRINHLHLCE